MLTPLGAPARCLHGIASAKAAYLDDDFRRGVSVWAKVGPDAEQRAVHNLGEDLAPGRWTEGNRDLVVVDAVELGLRLLIP